MGGELKACLILKRRCTQETGLVFRGMDGMKLFLTLLALFVLAACVPLPAEDKALPSRLTQPEIQVELQDYGPAPELENEVWLNTDQPLRLENLREKVVLVEMWTFG